MSGFAPLSEGRADMERDVPDKLLALTDEVID